MKPLIGTVVSDKMQKTIVVEVVDRWQHPVYKKVVLRSKKYKAHDEQSVAKVGDLVAIKSSRPISRNKAWVLDNVIKAGER